MAFKLTVVAIFLLALLFRFFLLGSYPVSLSMDEAAIGVNAYSILSTGRDEWGEKFPLAFKSVGDYKPPVEVYLTVPSIALFGLTEFAVRLPVALLGAATAVLIIFLLKELGLSGKASLFGGFWTAIVPWHVHFSRGSFEAVSALSFLILGAWLFLRWTKKENTWLLTGAVLSFSLSVWAYHAERLFVPILAVFLIVLFRRKFSHWSRKRFMVPVLTVLLFAIPFIKLSLFTPAVRERAASTSIVREQSLQQSLHSGKYSNFSEAVFDNDFYLLTRHFLGKYLNYFDIRFLFWKGLFTPPGYPDVGLLHLVDLPLVLLGAYGLLRNQNKLLKKVALFWLLAGPVPAALTINEQHGLRALTWLPFFALAVAVGFEKIRRPLIYFGLLLISAIYFSDMYLRQFPRFFSEFWQYGYKDIAVGVCENYDKYDRFVITDTFGTHGPLNTGTPYLYLLFYCEEYREDFAKVRFESDKIAFRRPNEQDFLYKGKILLIGSTWDFPENLETKGKVIRTLYFLSGEKSFLLVEPNAKAN